jgi:hypothetical protein
MRYLNYDRLWHHENEYTGTEMRLLGAFFEATTLSIFFNDFGER